jgi:protein TonB
MRYKDEKADLPGQFNQNYRKSLIITLLALLLISLTYVTVQVKRIEGPEYQQTIEIEEIEETRQQIEKEEPPKQTIAEVIEADDDEVPDTVTIAETDLVIDSFVPPPPPDEGEIVDFFALESPPTPQKQVEAAYPDLAKKGQVEGRVLVEVIIGIDGSVESAKVVAAEPEGFFEDAALAAAKQWRFSPAMQRDKPVRVRYQIPFRFRIR